LVIHLLVATYIGSWWFLGGTINNRQEDEQFFIRLLCHQCLSEAAAAPGQDVFLPGNDCAQAPRGTAGHRGSPKLGDRMVVLLGLLGLKG
jgi:hypothetical protein